MKRTHVHKALLAATATGLVLTAAACSSDQKPAALGTTGAGATSAATSSSATSGTSSAAASSSSSASAAAGTSSAPPAPTTIATSSGGWTYKATVPGDANAAAALAAFQKYREIVFQMSTKPDYSKDLSDYADGNVLTLANNFVLQLKQGNQVMTGTATETVTSSSLAMSATPAPLMTVVVCKDATKYHQVFSYGPKKGKTAVNDITHPYPLTYTVHKSADGKWRVTDVHSDSDKTC